MTASKLACSTVCTYSKTDNITAIADMVKTGKNRNLNHSVSNIFSIDFFANRFLITRMRKNNTTFISKYANTEAIAYCCSDIFISKDSQLIIKNAKKSIASNSASNKIANTKDFFRLILTCQNINIENIKMAIICLIAKYSEKPYASRHMLPSNNTN